MAMATLCSFPASFKKNTALFASIRGRGSETASHRRQTPFLYICFDEDETRLSKVYVNCAGPVGSNSREKILGLEAMSDILQFLAVSSEEYCPGPRSISYADDIPLHKLWTICWAIKRLIISSMPRGRISDGILMPT